MGITLFTMVKDEGQFLQGLVESVKGLVDAKIALVDIDSKDNSMEEAERLFDRVYPVRFPDSFGALATMGLHLCALDSVNPHALWLDCDERLVSAGTLMSHLQRVGYFQNTSNRAIAFQRKRWSAWEKIPYDGRSIAITTQIEPTNPDWQPRLIPVRAGVKLTRPVHITLEGCDVIHMPTGIAYIDHFHDIVKTPEALKARQELYSELAFKAKLAVEGGQPLDQMCSCGHTRADHDGAYGYTKPPYTCLGNVEDNDYLCKCNSFTPR